MKYKSKKKNSKRSHLNSKSYIGYNQATMYMHNTNKYMDGKSKFGSTVLNLLKQFAKKKV